MSTFAPGAFDPVMEVGSTPDATTGELVRVPVASPFSEIGSNSSYNLLNDAYVGQALFPRRNALLTFGKMMRSDAQVRTTVRACWIPVLGAEWHVEAASQDPVAVEQAQFIEYNLFQYMTTPWVRVLESAMTMLPFGSSVFEQVWTVGKWRRPEKNSNSRDMVLLRKLAFRPQSTILRYLYDANGGPNGILHLYVDMNNPASQQQEREIGIDKLVVFTFDQEANNLEGTSILRSAYKHWYMKDNFYKIDAIQKERHGLGVPEIKPPIGYSQNELSYAQQLGRNMRVNENAFIVTPPGWEIGFAKVEGNLVDALRSASHHDMMIARNVLIQFINAGSEGSGSSRAASATEYDLFLKSMRHSANLVADGFNQYVIPRLIRWNYDNTTDFPKLKVRGLGESRDIQQVSSGLERMVASRVITPDDTLERHIRNVFDLPTTWEASKEPRIAPALPPGAMTGGFKGGNNPSSKGANES